MLYNHSIFDLRFLLIFRPRANISQIVMASFSDIFWITYATRNWCYPKTFRKRKDWPWKRTITNYQGRYPFSIDFSQIPIVLPQSILSIFNGMFFGILGWHSHNKGSGFFRQQYITSILVPNNRVVSNKRMQGIAYLT